MKARFFQLTSLAVTLTMLLAPFTATVGAAPDSGATSPVSQSQSQGTNQTASVLPVWAQPPAAVTQPATFYKVIAQPGVLDASQEGITLWHDYGAFALYKVSAATLNQLSSATRSKIQVATDMDYIMLDAYPFDTQTDTFDAIPEPFRVTQPDGPALHLIQFVGPIKDAWLQAVKEAGAEPIHYIANYGYLVWADDTARARLNDMARAKDFLQFSAPYQTYFKLGASLNNRLTSAYDREEVVKVTIQMYDHAGKDTTERLIAELLRGQLSPWTPILDYQNVVAKVRAGDLATIAAQPDVFWIGEYFERERMDEVQDQILAANFNVGQTGPSGPGYLAWLTGYSFSTDPSDYPVVDITDGGIGNGAVNSGDYTLHEFGNIANPTRLQYVGNCTDSADGGGPDGHGHINTSIVGSYDTTTGFPYQDPNGFNRGLGVNPYARLAGTRIFDASGFDLSGCGGTDTGLIKHVQDAGAQIASNSWGCAGCAGSYDASSQAFDVGVRDADLTEAGNQELTFIFSAGNSGPGAGTVGTPGNGKNMITVGASENDRPSDEDGPWTDGCGIGPTGADNAMDIISFSSRGPSPGDRVKPEVIAPGTHIQGTASTHPSYNGSGVCDQYRPSGQTIFAASSGTSHSAPAVAGVSSLYYYWLETHYGITSSPALMKAYLIAHPTYLTGVSANDTLPSNNQGYGMPNMALGFDDTPRYMVNQTEVFDNSGENWTFSADVVDPGKPVRVVMAYTDEAGAVGTSPEVNDLNLEVTVGGNTYLGNNFSGQWSVTGGSADDDNNYEAVFLPAGTSGQINVTITAFNIAGDGIPNTGDGTDQDFALVIYNATQEGVGLLDGTVYESGGAPATDPITGASVQATGLVPTHTGSTTSGADGYYRMGLLTDTYTVTAIAYGYQVAQLSGVPVVSGTTTTLNIPLTPVAMYVVSGTVTDTTTGWPLYACVAIGGDPVNPPSPYDEVWTDPATGYYSITLAEDITYTFDVEAWVDGYNTASRDVGPLTMGVTQDFGLTADAGTCNAPGYSPVYAYMEDFEASDGGYTHMGTWDEWEWGTPTVWPNGCASGSNCWGTDLDSDYENSASQNLTSTSINLTGVTSGTTLIAKWWQALSIESSTYDHAYAEVSINGGAWTEMWSHIGGTGQTDWTEMSYDISAAAGGNVQCRWRHTSDSSVTYEGYYIDDVNITVGCVPSPGGLLVGNVYDDNTSAPLVGAEVANEDGHVATTAATPDDADVDDGFYTVFSPHGSKTFTATMTGYQADVVTVTVVQSDTVWQDFYLPAPQVEVAPTLLSYTLELGQQFTQTPGLVISNTGTGGLYFELWEKKSGFQPTTLATGPFAADVESLVPPEYREAGTTAGLDLPPASVNAILAAGDVIQSWSSGLAEAWGIAYTSDDHVWVSEGWGTTNSTYEYLSDGTPTGVSHTFDWMPSYGPADNAFNWNTDMVWTLDVGGDDCIHEMDPVTGYTGDTVCGPWTVSQRGVAYDPETDTWYVGGWNENTVYHIDSSGALLDSANVGLGISGLAYNPETQHLFVQVNGGTNDVYVLDASTAGVYTQTGQFHIGALSAGAGLEIDCEGNLWAVDQNDETVYQAESGETASLCQQNTVPWLSEDPISGTVAPSGSLSVDIGWWANVPEADQPGDYYANLRIKGNDPVNPNVVLPVTMTVTAPPDWGKLAGAVTSLGHCDVNPAPLEDAELFIEGVSGMTWTLTTNISGTYSYWFDEAESPLTVTVTHPEHEMGMATGVLITGGTTTTQDFDLRWLEPCVDVEAPTLEAVLDMGMSTTFPISITNTGAVSTGFELTERDRGFQLAVLSLFAGYGEWLYRDEAGIPVQTNQGDETLAHPSAYRWQPAWMSPSAPSALNILIYADDFTHTAPNTYLDQALQALGLAYTAHYNNDFGGFETDLTTGGPWDIVLFGNDNYGPPASTWTALDNYANAGGKLVIHTWRVSNYLGDPLWTTLGFTWVSDVTTGDDVYWWDSGHMIFDGVPEFIGLTAAGGVQGQRVEPLSGFEALAGYTTPGPDSNEAGLILGNDGRTVFRGFLDAGNDLNNDGDATLDGVELWMNLIDGIQVGFSSDVPWLFEDPITGTLAADTGFETASVTLDAAYVGQPGIYYATLNVNSDDPVNDEISIPVTMTVNVPTGWGKLMGTINSLGYCDVNLAPLEGAEVFIEDSVGMTWTLTTGVSGAYGYWLDEGGYTVTASYADHLSETVAVSIVSQVTTTQDFDLRLLQPCVSAAPLSMEATLLPGASEVQTLTLTNDGAVASSFQIREHEVNVLYDDTHGGNSTRYDELMANLAAAGAVVDIVSTGPINAALLADYDIYWAPDSTTVAWTTAELDDIEAWVNGGGGLFANYDCCNDTTVPTLTARFDINYLGVGGTGGVTTDTYPHPTTGGVISINLTGPFQSITVTGLAEVIVNDVGGDPQVAANEPGSGRVVVVADDAFNDGTYATYDNALFASNIFDWLASSTDVPWLSEYLITGTVGADSFFDISITFTALPTMTFGTYTATLSVNTDDAVTPKINIPVTMTIATAASWEKLVYVNGVPADTFPVTVVPSDTVQIVDRVWITHTHNVTFTLVETWTGSLDLTGWISDTGDAALAGHTLTWDVINVASNTWYAITKTFTVLTGHTHTITESLWVENAYPQPDDRVLTFQHSDRYIYLPIVMRNY